MGKYNNSRAKAHKEMQVEAVPHKVIDDAAAGQVKVGKGNICRIEGTAGGFVMFQKEGDTTVPSVSSKETIKTELGFFKVAATEDYIRTSAVMRIEVIED